MSVALATTGKPIRCTAAVCRGPKEPFQLEDIIVAPPKAHELRVKIICTAVCHSDLTMWQDRTMSFPMIFGHEAVGQVESVGEDVDPQEVAPGDFVITNWLTICGHCDDCKSEESNLCSGLPFKITPGMLRDGTSRFSNDKGETINHFIFVSSFSEYTVVDIANITKVCIDDVPLTKACLLSCGVTTGTGAAWKVADIQAGSTVVVFGLGTIGCAVIAAAHLRGAAKIIGVDIKPAKADHGRNFGMTDFIDPNNCGGKNVWEAWGKLIILDGFHFDSKIDFEANDILMKGSTVTGTLLGGYKHKYDIPKLVNKWKNKELKLDGFATIELDFEAINEAVTRLLDAEGLRSIIWVDKSFKKMMK